MNTKNILGSLGYPLKTVTSKRGEDHSLDHLLDHGYHPLGRLPGWVRGFDRDRLYNINKANRYLKFQELRIMKAIKNGELRKAVLI